MPTPPITLFEHQFRSYAEIGLFPDDLTRRERVLEKIERINQSAGQEVLRLERKGLRATQWVGVLHVDGFTFEVLPKLDYQATNPPDAGSPRAAGADKSADMGGAHTAAENLLVMLSYAYDLDLQAHTTADLATARLPWFERLTRLFATHLYRQILSGLSHSYIAQEDTIPVLRGRWNVQRQIARQGPARHIFDVRFDDYSPDIPLNQVFRFVIEQLGRLSQDPENRALLSELREWFQPVALLTEIPADLLEQVQFNRLNERFQPAFHLARLFLSGCAVQLSQGAVPLYAFMLDMNLLFERFVAGFLRQHRAKILPAGQRDLAILPQSEGTRLYLATCDRQPVARLRPDLLLKHKGAADPLLVIDTKYKKLDVTGRRFNVSPDDLYQMLAYSIRTHCPRVMLLYPQPPASRAIRKEFQIENTDTRLYVNTINLRAPLHPPDALIEEIRDLLQTTLKEGHE